MDGEFAFMKSDYVWKKERNPFRESPETDEECLAESDRLLEMEAVDDERLNEGDGENANKKR